MVNWSSNWRLLDDFNWFPVLRNFTGAILQNVFSSGKAHLLGIRLWNLNKKCKQMASTCFFRQFARHCRTILFHVPKQTLNEIKPKHRNFKRTLTLTLGAVAATGLKKDDDAIQLQVISSDYSTGTCYFLSACVQYTLSLIIF